MLKPFFKVAGYVAAGLAGVVVVYLVVAFTVSGVPVNGDDDFDTGDVTIYILSNGVHTDLVVPVRNEQMDWTRLVSPAHTPAPDSTAAMPYLGIGWGDKGFYMDTPTWADLTFSTAFKAAFWLSSSAMHTTFHSLDDLREGENCVKIKMTRDEYARLVAYIKSKFQLDAQGNSRWIPGHSYGRNDSFYEAQGVYNLFYSCNTWTNNGLKVAGQRASLWTVHDRGIFNHYQP